MGDLSYAYFYPFSDIGDYQQKRSPTGVFFVLSDSLKLKAPSSIYFLGLAKNPRYCTITVSLYTTPQKTFWQHSPFGSPLFRVLYNVSSLDPINIKSVHLPQVFPICSDIPGITAMITFPRVSFICCMVCPAVILWTKKVWVYHAPPALVQLFPSPFPPHLVGQSADCLTPFGYLPCTHGQGNSIALTRGSSHSVDNNTYIP